MPRDRSSIVCARPSWERACSRTWRVNFEACPSWERACSRTVLILLLSCASSLSSASPFVNITPDPELAALRPVATLEAPPQGASTTEPSLPALVLNFIPDEDVRKAKLHFADVWD